MIQIRLPMAALFLSPTSHVLRNPHKFSNLLSNHSHHQRLPVSLTATAPLHRKTDQRSQSQHVATNDWSFGQRMEEALNVLELMEAQGMEPEPSLICILLKSCAEAENIEFGKIVHSKIIGTQLENDLFVANNLINLYVKCRCFGTARQLFDKMPYRNAVTWTSIISMYSQSNFPDKALRLYNLMKSDSQIRPNVFTYTIALNSCAKTKNINMGIEIHEDIVKDGCESDDFIATALIDMYSKCGRIDNARQVFDKIGAPTAAACTAMIDGYNTNNQAKEALGLIRRILGWGLDMKVVKELGFTCLIRSCIMEAALRQGQEIHGHLIKFGYELGAQTLSSFLVLYEKCNRMVLARRLFDMLLVKNARLWGRMISGYVRNGLNQDALKLYLEMVCEDVEPNPFILTWVLNACVGVSGLREGKQIHGHAIKAGFGLSEDYVLLSLVRFYRECGLDDEVDKLKKCHRNKQKIELPTKVLRT